MNQGLEVAQFLWIGSSLSKIEQLCLQSFVDHGYAVHLYVYDEVAGVPAGVKFCPAETVLPRSRIFTYQQGFGRGSYAGFASLFRYHLLHEKGGWWFDTDFISIRRRPTPHDLWIATSHEGRAGILANNCALYAPPRHPLIARLRDRAEAILRDDPPIHFGQIGPCLLQDLVRAGDLDPYLAPWWEFSPYPVGQLRQLTPRTPGEWMLGRLRTIYYTAKQCIDPTFKAGYVRSGTRAMHLYNELWRLGGIDKNATYHRFSVLERAKRRHPTRLSA
jgi:hypothetical protein